MQALPKNENGNVVGGGSGCYDIYSLYVTLGLSLLFAESLWSIGCGSDRCVLCLSDVGPTGVCCACVQSIVYIVYIG